MLAKQFGWIGVYFYYLFIYCSAFLLQKDDAVYREMVEARQEVEAMVRLRQKAVEEARGGSEFTTSCQLTLLVYRLPHCR